MINLTEVGASAFFANDGTAHIQFGLYLPGVRSTDGFSIVLRVIHSADRFNPSVQPQDQSMTWNAGTPLDLWTTDMTLANAGHSGQEGVYLYRFQSWWTPQSGAAQLITEWFTDPFAGSTDLGLLASVELAVAPTPFVWTDSAYLTPELDDLIVYELQVEEFNDSFDGVVDRLDYLASLGVNCIELMPVTSAKLEFDWDYGPVFYFSPNVRFGGGSGLKRLVDAAHGRGIAVILDVVYEHVDPAFPYYAVYNDIANSSAAVKPASPMISGWNVWGFGPAADFTQQFTKDYFVAANQMWLDEYHVDGFRYDEVSDLYVGARAAGYQYLVEQVYLYSQGIARFQGGANTYSRVIQCAEALGISRQVLAETYTNCAWTDELLDKSEDMMQWNYVDDNFAHILDPNFDGYPATTTVVDSTGAAIAMPVAPFQYLETHDHSQLIVFAGTDPSDSGPLLEGNRDLFYKLQPYAIALYTAQGIPMLWQGQEFADNYNLPGSGSARIHLRRDTHWEYFYDLGGLALIRIYRRLGTLRHAHPALRSRESYYYYQQSHQGTQILAYHRHAAATATAAEEWAMVLLNFGAAAGQIQVPFPKAGTWTEMLDADQRTFALTVANDGDVETVTVPSNYGMVFVLG
jgi:maltooligosyltrehalose trehalohydrolase